MASEAKNLRPPQETCPASDATRWAVLVGITQYRQIGQPDLKYCVNDVEKLKDVLENYAGYDEVELFANQRATKVRIEKEIRHVADVAPPDAVLLFHFSGHGMAEGGRSYLIAADTRAPLSKNGIDILALQQELAEEYGRRKVVFVLDCCRERVGKSALEGGLAKSFYLPKEDIPDGMAILYSCQENGIAWEMDDQLHGAFTYF